METLLWYETAKFGGYVEVFITLCCSYILTATAAKLKEIFKG